MSALRTRSFLRMNAAVLTLILAGSVLAVVGFVGSVTGSPADAADPVPRRSTPAASRPSSAAATPDPTASPSATTGPTAEPTAEPTTEPTSAAPAPGPAPAPVPVNLALHRPATATGQIRDENGPSYATDGVATTYWEGPHHGLPDSLTVDLGAPTPISRLVLKLPTVAGTWPARTQTLSVLGSTDGSAFTVIQKSATYSFTPQNTNTATIAVSAASVRYVRLTFTDNSVWDAAQAGEVELYR